MASLVTITLTLTTTAAVADRPDVWISAATHPPSTRSASAPRPDPPPQRCEGSRRAIVYYRRAYTRHRETMRLPGAPTLVRAGCNTTRTMAAKWRELGYRSRIQAQKWVRDNYAWWLWLPVNWQRLGACETGYGRIPGNFRHANRSFVSAFGITRANYARDAAWSGTPQWDDENPPTPREQYEAALAHYEHHGDGWGCAGP